MKTFAFICIAFLCLSCSIGQIKTEDDNKEQNQEQNSEVLADTADVVLQDTSIVLKTIVIPFEYDNPVANIVAFDIDKNECRHVEAEVDFFFEVLTTSEWESEEREINLMSEYKDERFSFVMESRNVCRIDVFKQEEPFSPVEKYIVFYTQDKEYLEDFVLIIDEDATKKDY